MCIILYITKKLKQMQDYKDDDSNKVKIIPI